MPRPIAVYDLRGLNCPLPVLKARRKLGKMRPGARIWLETTDPLAALDIPVFCREAGHVLVETEVAAFGHRFLVRRKPSASAAVSPGSLRSPADCP